MQQIKLWQIDDTNSVKQVKKERLDYENRLEKWLIEDISILSNNLAVIGSQVPFDTYGNYLTKEDGMRGRNFFNGFGIFEAVKKYRKYNKSLYSNLLRSEHIPFNFFIPLDKNRDYCKDVFAEISNTRLLALYRHYAYSLDHWKDYAGFLGGEIGLGDSSQKGLNRPKQ